MATASEVLSLEEINYKSPSKLKAFLVGVLGFFLLVIGFLNFYPIGTQLKKVLRTQLQGSGCNPDYADLTVNPLFAKILVTDLTIPASCFNREGEALKLNFVSINYRLINFMPLGLPFRIDTDLAGQPFSMHFVLGFGEHLVRIMDQKISLSKVLPLIAPDLKMAGNVMVDLSLRTNNQGAMTSLALKADSNDLVLPSQTIEQMAFTLPNLKLNKFYLEAHSDVAPRIIVDRLMAGNPDSPIRANFKGRIDLQPGGAAFSPMELKGEMAFTKELIDTLPILDMVMQGFPQKDGFYQVKLGGTLGAPKGLAP